MVKQMAATCSVHPRDHRKMLFTSTGGHLTVRIPQALFCLCLVFAINDKIPLYIKKIFNSKSARKLPSSALCISFFFSSSSSLSLNLIGFLDSFLIVFRSSDRSDDESCVLSSLKLLESSAETDFAHKV